MTRDEKIQAVYRLFNWLNHVSDTGAEIALDDIRPLFTELCPMIYNNQLICRDHATHFKHALDLRTQLKSWHFNLPFERIIVEQDQVAGYYTADLIRQDGKKSRMLDLCIFTVRDGKISGILENVVFDGQSLANNSFA